MPFPQASASAEIPVDATPAGTVSTHQCVRVFLQGQELPCKEPTAYQCHGRFPRRQPTGVSGEGYGGSFVAKIKPTVGIIMRGVLR